MSSMKNKGIPVILSGPSGCGKGTVREILFRKHPELAFSVSCTTRAPRAGETDGVDYHFISKESFDKMVEEGAFLEWARFVGTSYGTPLAPIKQWMDDGISPVLEIDVQGATQIRRKLPQTISIFLLPPSVEELERRLRSRGTETDEVIAGRLARAKEEMQEADKYDYQVINDEPERAAQEIADIIEKCKSFQV